MKYGCYVLMIGLVAGLAQAQTHTQTPPPKKETPSEWICRVLRIDPKIYARLVGVRQGQEQIGGARLAVADLTAQSESIIYECGECWSPAVSDRDNVAYLKADGLWVKQLDGGPSRLAVSARGLRMLIGKVDGHSSEWVVLQHGKDEVCEYKLAIADVAAGTLNSQAEQPQCLMEAELGAIPRSGALRGSRLLVNSAAGTGVRRILIGELSRDGTVAAAGRSPLLPWIDAHEDGIDRFDAVWLDDTRVVYMQK